MNSLTGACGRLTGIVTITRKSTGAVETYSISGLVKPPSVDPDQKVESDDSHPLRSSPERSD